MAGNSCIYPGLSVLGGEHMLCTLHPAGAARGRGSGCIEEGLGHPLGPIILLMLCFWPPEQVALGTLQGCSSPSPRRVGSCATCLSLCSGSGWGLAPPATPVFSDSGSRGWSAGWARCSCRTVLPGLRPLRPAVRCVAGAATCRSSSTVCTLACASRSSSASSEVGWRAVLGRAVPGV